jgi:streptogramin lyase
MNPSRPVPPEVISPDNGVQGGLAYHDGQAWVGGFDEVSAIRNGSTTPGAGQIVGLVRNLAFGMGSIWAVSGELTTQGIPVKLRRIDPETGMIEQSISVGAAPVAVAAAGAWVWVEDRTGRAIQRIDPATNSVVDTIPLGEPPVALAAEADGVWVVVE